MNRNYLGYCIENELDNPSPEFKSQIEKKYKNFNIKLPIIQPLPAVEINPPKLPKQFNSFREFFEYAAEDCFGEDTKLLHDLFNFYLLYGYPKAVKPNNVKLNKGWSIYDKEGIFVKEIDAPQEPILVFDVETFVEGGSYPIIATATGKENSYIWLAREFVEVCPEDEWDQFSHVPLPYTKVIIGHNVGYDIVRVREAYDWYNPIKFFDTMSAHIVCSGFAGAQRYISILKEKLPSKLTARERRILSEAPEWFDKGTTNSLVAVYNFHVASLFDWFGENLEEPLKDADKKIRNVFVITKTVKDFVDMGDFRLQLVSYASYDTYYTARIFRHLFPKYLSHKQSPVNLSGHLALSTARVPLVDNWFEWINTCESLLERDELEVSELLHKECLNIIKDWKTNPTSVENDFFYGQLDWTVKRRKTPKGFEQFGENDNSKWSYVPNWFYPMWKDPKLPITTKADITHLILRIHWNNYPLRKLKDNGWVYYPEGDNYNFVKVPHKENPGANTGSVLSKQFIEEMQNGTITGDHPLTKRFFEIAIRDSFWVSVRSRVKERIVKKSYTSEGDPFLMMVPSYVINGTITSRAIENLLLMMSSVKQNKIGTELKSRIQAPKGYCVVGGDISGQEMQLASIIADNYAGGYLGASPMTHQVISGNKETFSDAHSVVAYELFLKDKGYKMIDGEWYIEEP